MADPPLSLDGLVAMLGQTLGDAKAREVLTATVTRLGLPRGALTVPQALAVLEAVAEQPGIVGTTARFAKSRVHLGSLGKKKTA